MHLPSQTVTLTVAKFFFHTLLLRNHVKKKIFTHTIENMLFCSRKSVTFDCLFNSTWKLCFSPNRWLVTAKQYKKLFPIYDWKSELKPFQFTGSSHISLHPHFCPAGSLPSGCDRPVSPQWANGRRTLAWERAWQKLQHGGADLRCEPQFLGPEEGSSWSPGAFLQTTTEKRNAQMFILSFLCFTTTGHFVFSHAAILKTVHYIWLYKFTNAITVNNEQFQTVLW